MTKFKNNKLKNNIIEFNSEILKFCKTKKLS